MTAVHRDHIAVAFPIIASATRGGFFDPSGFVGEAQRALLGMEKRGRDDEGEEEPELHEISLQMPQIDASEKQKRSQLPDSVKKRP